MGPIVLESISERIHGDGGVIDCHLMVANPAQALRRDRASRAATASRSTTRRCATCAASCRRRASRSSRSGSRSSPRPRCSGVVAAAEGVDLVLCMSIEPGYSGQEFLRGLARAHPLDAGQPAARGARPGRRRDQRGERPGRARRGRDAARLRERDLRARGSAAGLPPLGTSAGVSHLERALELAERGRGTTHPNPVVGAVVVTPGGDVVGEGWHEQAGGPHAEVVALARGRRAARRERRCTSRSSRARASAARRRASTRSSARASRRSSSAPTTRRRSGRRAPARAGRRGRAPRPLGARAARTRPGARG